MVLFALAAALTILFWPRPKSYTPGEHVAGITSALERAIPADYPGVKFVDATTTAGITFRHFHGKRSSQLPEDMGSGAAWGDFDRDGLPDLFLANQAGPLSLTAAEMAASPARCALYRNDGNGRFTDVTDLMGLSSLKGQFMAGAWGDYDNDGFPDLLVTSYGGLRLFHNVKGERFEDVTKRMGLGGFKGFWTGVSWADYDRDGLLDAYVCGYVKYTEAAAERKGSISKQFGADVPATLNPSSYLPERNLLFHNEGSRFREVGKQAGVDNPTGRSLSAAWCDFDGDGLPDLYVNNDVSMHAFYRNLGNGKFEDITITSLACDYRGGMGIAIGDWDNGGRMNLFLTHWLAQENALYQCVANVGKPGSAKGPGKKLRFIDISDQVGLGQSSLDYVGWGTAFLDFDNDGHLDIAIANGSTLQDAADSTRLVPMRNQLYWNGCKTSGYLENGANDRGFFEVEDVAGKELTHPNIGRGLAVADYDRDGAPDILITRNGDTPLLLHNEGGSKNNWIAFRLEGTESNRDAIGARITLWSGQNRQIRVVGASSSYLSQEELTQTFGLGSAARVNRGEIVWPSGAHQTFGPLDSRQVMYIIEGKAPVRMMPGRRLP